MSEAVAENLVYEGDVAEQLGLSRKALAKVRAGLDLIEEVDWCNGPHRRLMLTDSGYKKICVAVDAGRVPDGAAFAGEGEWQGGRYEGAVGDSEDSQGVPDMPVFPKMRAPKKLEARVVRLPKFRKLLECRREQGGPILRVRVQNNENFMPGMVVPIREAVGQGPGIFYYDGGLPKRKGVMPKTRKDTK